MKYICYQGIAGDRITTRGMGASKPFINSPGDEIGHLLNRRTTFTITALQPSGQLKIREDPYPVIALSNSTATETASKTKETDISEISGLNYRVQILASRNRFAPGARIKNLSRLVKDSGIIVTQEGNLYKYQIGPFRTRPDAEAVLKNAKSLGQDAFLVEYQGNLKIK
jgi:hypothetical protein